MKQELKRIAPLRAANISALVHALITCVFALLFSPFFLLMAIFAPTHEARFMGPLFVFFMLVFYPIMGLVMGWIIGLVGAAAYNLVTRLTGGLLLDFESAPQSRAVQQPEPQGMETS
jgi:hypothetical protein